ncbi:dienelactone hydrolase [Herbihabitans rhizosphaerae]|uniref:Dienelactone hydrolase n=1 Tax=Herbihabitans rhizosphaerae TaxID=1872711 RepID=A0A4Q7KMK7_9PSEU|nr:alpha/beta hydrolase fold domain-containing protein [Herbihabitans rhizosphaerae]RZS36821.1 dienelactone hydrolase [Herbihabitans rhizosphaerae]
MTIRGNTEAEPTARRGRGLRRTWTVLTGLVAAAALAVATLPGASPHAQAAGNPYERGSAPTKASIEAPTGTFAIKQVAVPGGQGFGGGKLWYPTDTAQGTFGVVAVSPGFMSAEPFISWYGPRLASQGFVVITISTNAPVDFPTQRAEQLLAALKYVVDTSEAKSAADPSRLAVMGHSMGGGGSLEAALKVPALKATVPLTPWDLASDFSAVKTPTLIVSAQADNWATMARTFYQSLSPTLNRAHIQLAGAGHNAPTVPNVTIAKYSLSWLKRFVDNDTRYEQFLCPLPTSDPKISAFEGNCPHN